VFAKGVNSKTQYLNEQGTVSHKCYDSIVFKAIRAKFGGNLRVMITGSAPIAPEIMTFFRIALSIPVSEAYGQTEGGPMTLTSTFDPTVGHCGGPIPVTKMRVRDLPELEYMSTDSPCPRGEL
jgi:long-chain acyl-CoA synthetase